MLIEGGAGLVCLHSQNTNYDGKSHPTSNSYGQRKGKESTNYIFKRSMLNFPVHASLCRCNGEINSFMLIK